MGLIFEAQTILHLDSASLDHKLLKHRVILVLIHILLIAPNGNDQ